MPNLSASLTSVTVTNASGPLVGGSTIRSSLLISSPSSGRITISDQNPAVLDAGLTIYTATAPTKLLASELGDFMQKPLYAIGSAASVVVGVLETLVLP